MNDLTSAVSKQIESCRELLKIFQTERQLYIDRPRIDINDVNRILCRKKQLVEIFDHQHQLICDLKEQVAAGQSPADKDLMRELGSILEQLLVIDHENEKLLRQCLTTRDPGNSGNSTENLSGRQRPALQRQLPFVPGGTRPAAPIAPPLPRERMETRPAATAAPVPPPAPAIKADVPVARAGGKHLLRQYTSTANLLTLTSKYA